MNWQEPATALAHRHGSAAEFAVRSLLSAALPGGPVLADLACSAFEALRLSGDGGPGQDASEADQQRLGRLLALVSGDLAGLLDRIAALQGEPHLARQAVNEAIATEQNTLQAIRKLEDLATTFDCLVAQLAETLHSLDYPPGQITLVPLLSRLVGVAAWAEEMQEEGLATADFCARLARVQEVGQAFADGDFSRMEAELARLVQQGSASLAAQVALAAAQVLRPDINAAWHALSEAMGDIPDAPPYWEVLDFSIALSSCTCPGGCSALDPRHQLEVRLAKNSPTPERKIWVGVPGQWTSPTEGRFMRYWATQAITPGFVPVQSGAAYRLEVAALAGDDDLQGLADLNGVEEFRALVLYGCRRLTDAGLASLRGLPDLRKLKLWECETLTDDALVHLQYLQGLRSLTVRLCDQLTNAGLVHLTNLPRLRKLSLSPYRRLTDAGVAHVGRLVTLKSLSFHCCGQITGAALAHVANLPDLKHLDLGKCEAIADGDFAHLRGLPRLRSLNLIGNKQLTDGALEPLGRLTGLRGLVLAECEQITDAGLVRLRGHASLRDLSIGECPRITDDGLAHLRELPVLQTLELDHSEQLTDRGLVHLRHLSNLRDLDLESCPGLTDDGLAHLREVPTLQELHLGFSPHLTDKGLAHLRHLPNLQHLYLEGRRFTPSALAALQATLPGCKIKT